MINFEQIAAANMLTTNKNGYVYIKPEGKFDFTTYPVNKNECILISPEEYIGLIQRTHIFNDQLTGVIEYIIPKNEENTLTNQQE